MSPRHQQDDELQRLDLKIWRVLLRRAMKYPGYMAMMLTLAVTMGLMQTAMPWITGKIVDSIFGGGETSWQLLTGIYFAAAMIFSFTVWVFINTCGKLVTRFSHDLREECFEKLQNLSFSFYDRKSVGWLVTRLTSDSDRLARIFSWGMMDLIWGSLFLIFIMISMLLLNWQLALIVLTVVPPLLVISMFFKRKLLNINRKVRKTNSQITAGFSESISGVQTTKTLVREEENLGEFKQLTGEMFGLSVRNAIVSSMYLPTVMALGSIGAGLALWFGGMKTQMVTSGISIGMLVAFITYARQFFNPVQELARLLTEFQAAQAAAERIVSLLDTEPEIQDSPEVLEKIEATKQQYSDKPRPFEIAEDGLPNKINTIEFRNVDFEYIAGEKVLTNFNLTINAGETIAIVGPTGGGKSTIVSLICRFYEPTAGEILINGVDYRERSLHWLSSNLGIVLQTPQLFSGSIAENIRYGKLTAADGEVQAAAGLVHADSFIRELPDGFEAKIGEGGNELSTGQKQLISFARAILADPQIFVMDEATSSIDTETEQAIQLGLEKILEDRISFVIAHRLSTIRSADRILYVKAGKIIEEGTHHDLIAKRGEYYNLYASQFTAEHTAQILTD